jgi:hypothetical protein
MLANLLPAVFCLALACALMLLALCIALLAPWLRLLLKRIREHDARARMNRRRREIDEAKWRELERRAEFRAGMHSKLTGGA